MRPSARQAWPPSDERGVDDEVVAAAMFTRRRGHFEVQGLAGGLVGDSVAGGVGRLGGGAGGHQHAADGCFADAGALHRRRVGDEVTALTQRAKADASRPMWTSAVDHEPQVNVHQRFNVLGVGRRASGAAIEPEGPRLPGFHAGT
jgi:hypothetical protein